MPERTVKTGSYFVGVPYVAMVTTFGPSVLRSFLVRTEEVPADCLA